MVTRDERYERYRQGICVDCGGKPHSAGRPRCNQCHDAYVVPLIQPQLTPRSEAQRGAIDR